MHEPCNSIDVNLQIFNLPLKFGNSEQKQAIISQKQLQAAHLLISFQNLMGYPQNQSYKDITRHHLLNNCPLNVDDINRSK